MPVTKVKVNGEWIPAMPVGGGGDMTKAVYDTNDDGVVNAADQATKDGSGNVITTTYAAKATTLSGYGITDAKIQNGSIILGSNSITPLTSFTETDPTVPAWAKAASKPTYTAAEVNAIPTSAKGAANGVAELDANGLVPTSQLPSYVDDVLEYATKSSFPATGETGKIYVDISTNLTYRWSGSAYVEISPSLALGTTSSTAFRGDYGQSAYTHAVTNKGSAFTSGLYKITTNSEGHVTNAVAVTSSDIPGLSSKADSATTLAGYGITDANIQNGTITLGSNTITPLTSYTETDPIFTASASYGITSNDITNWNNKTSNTGTVTSVRVQATSPVQSSVNTAQSTTLDTTISLVDAYGDTKNPYGTKTANYVLAGPASGNAAAPSFRVLVADDIPSLTASKISDISLSNGTITIGNNSITPLTSAPVTSVNGQTGAVVIDDTGTFIVPVTLTWDDQTQEYTATTTVDVDDIWDAYTNGSTIIVKANYDGDDADNLFSLDFAEHYIYNSNISYTSFDFRAVDTAGEHADLNGYVTGEYITIRKNNGVQELFYNYEENTIPNKTSDLTNDSGFIVSDEVGKVYVSDTEPSTSNNYDIWIDTSSNLINANGVMV